MSRFSWKLRENQNDSSELFHYGVLGMRWGVRRYQPYPKGKHGTFLGQSRDEDIRIPKGTKAYRLDANKHLSGSGQTYVSLDMLDHLDYISLTASQDVPGVALDATVNNKNDGRAYSLRLKFDKDVILPSYQKTMDSFIKAVDEYGGSEKFAKDLWDQKDRVSMEKAKDFIESYKKLKVDDLRDHAYTLFAGTLFRDTKARKMFFDDLKSQGYTGIIDEADKKFGKGMTSTPVIVFEKDKSISMTKSKPLSEADYAYFRDLYYVGPETRYIRSHNPEASKEWDEFVEEKYQKVWGK